MKVSFIGLRGYPANFIGTSGIETRTEKIIQHLSKTNQIDIYIRQQQYTLTIPETAKHFIRIFTLPTINTKYLDTFIYSFIASIKAAFSSSRVVLYEGTGSTLLSFLPKITGKYIITTIHSLEWKRTKWPFLAKVYLKFLEIASVYLSDKLIVVSKELDQYIKCKYHKNAVYIPYFYEYKKKLTLYDCNLKQITNNDYILYLGRLVPEKRIEWLINAFNKLRTNKKLIIAGGESHSYSYLRNLKKLAFNNPNILFTGYVFGQEKEYLLSNCCLFVLPSKLEGFSVSLIEALGYNRRVLVADLYDHQLIISDKSCLFKSDNYDDFAVKLKRLLFNKTTNHTGIYSKKLISETEFHKKYDNLLSQIY